MSGLSLISYESLVHAISGACGSGSAMAVTLPLDTIRTRLLLDPGQSRRGSWQMLGRIVHEEGVLSLYYGAQSTILCVMVSNFVYFYAFHGLKQMLVGKASAQTAAKDLLLACLAGCVNVGLTNPLWVVNSQLKMQGQSRRSKVNEGTTHPRLRFRGLFGIATNS
eukprot:maker-scaffold263_size232787-snap-gene-1.19 protein:Tk11203 transcript:maker-scaffold263_size232787-snap-gene-1.19-mRNA-1 annotation:"solute carrier family 25 member 47"